MGVQFVRRALGARTLGEWWRDGKARGDVSAALDELAKRVPEMYLHIDLDALDPLVAPGIVDQPVPGGLRLEDLHGVIEGIARRFRVKAATLTTYDPARDERDETLGVVLGVIETVGSAAKT